jgi:hypothetical protein
VLWPLALANPIAETAPRTLREPVGAQATEVRTAQTLELRGLSASSSTSVGPHSDEIVVELAEQRSLLARRVAIVDGDGARRVRLVFAGDEECLSERTVNLSQPVQGPFPLEVPDPADDVELAGRTLAWALEDPRESLREEDRATGDSSYALLASDERFAAALDALARRTRSGQGRTRVEPQVVAALLAPYAVGSLEPRTHSPWVLDPPRISDVLGGDLHGSCELVRDPDGDRGSGPSRSYRLTGWIETAPRRDVEVADSPGTRSGSELRWRASWLRTTRLRLSGTVLRDDEGAGRLTWQVRAEVECACDQELGVPMMALELAMRWSGTLSSDGEVVAAPR